MDIMPYRPASLRWYYPDQVRGISQPAVSAKSTPSGISIRLIPILINLSVKVNRIEKHQADSPGALDDYSD